MIGIIFVAAALLPTMIVVGAHLLVYPNTSLLDLTRNPDVILLSQLVLYAAVFALMYRLLKIRTKLFWQPVSWNWPARSWPGFLFVGGVLYFALAGMSVLLPIPKHLPIDRLFQTTHGAAIMSAFAITLAPLMEELFFRGFLYPVLARRLGAVASVVITAAAFGLLHCAQLKYSWAVLIIFLVGVMLTTVRAITKSVGASFLVHVGYNATLSALIFAATSGFRHLERLNQ
jgi:membrane protease YdiL (CAAX protease family)